jgi:hypothetical protein
MADSLRPHSKFPHVFAIVRIDLPIDEKFPTNSISVVKVLSSEVAAESELSRLTLTQCAKGMHLFRLHDQAYSVNWQNRVFAEKFDRVVVM